MSEKNKFDKSRFLILFIITELKYFQENYNKIKHSFNFKLVKLVNKFIHYNFSIHDKSYFKDILY